MSLIALALLGTCISLLAVAVLAYPLFDAEVARRRRMYVETMATVLQDRGLRGPYARTEPIPSWAVDSMLPVDLPAARLGLYVPVDSDDNQVFYSLGHPYEVLETEARRRLMAYRWTDRRLGFIGIPVAIVGALATAVAVLV